MSTWVDTSQWKRWAERLREVMNQPCMCYSTGRWSATESHHERRECERCKTLREFDEFRSTPQPKEG